MKGWTCPECKRSFGRTNQSHGCAPAMPLEDAFVDRPDLRPIHLAVLKTLRKIADVRAEAVSIGVLFKRVRTFAELRPKRDALTLSFLLSREIASPRITKTIALSANRMAYFVDLRSAKDVDREVRDWLAEAYFSSPE